MQKLFISVVSVVLFFLAVVEGGSSIVAFSEYEGDSKGSFAGHPVILLGDQSAWKVHPDQKKKLSRWRAGDMVHVSLRRSEYFIKREHKFLLINENIGDGVKVMLVDYGPNPLRVVSSSEAHLPGVFSLPTRILQLSDGSNWMTENNWKPFEPGEVVYSAVCEISCGHNADHAFQFFIAGTGRDSRWVRLQNISR